MFEPAHKSGPLVSCRILIDRSPYFPNKLESNRFFHRTGNDKISSLAAKSTANTTNAAKKHERDWSTFLPLAETAIADQFVALLIPQTKVQRFEAGKEGDGFDFLEDGVGFVAAFQIHGGDAGAEMVNVVVADVSESHWRTLRQFVKRAALETDRGVVPVFRRVPR